MLHNLSTCQKKRLIDMGKKKKLGMKMKAKHYNIKSQKKKN
jgi:hypothetical protein